VQHRAHLDFVVAVKARQHFVAAARRLSQVLEHGLPECQPVLGARLVQAPHLAQVGAQRHPEHVRADFAADALSGQFVGQFDEHLVRDVRQGCAHATGRR
jgi:hypothetical protein